MYAVNYFKDTKFQHTALKLFYNPLISRFVKISGFFVPIEIAHLSKHSGLIRESLDNADLSTEEAVNDFFQTELFNGLEVDVNGVVFQCIWNKLNGIISAEWSLEEMLTPSAPSLNEIIKGFIILENLLVDRTVKNNLSSFVNSKLVYNQLVKYFTKEFIDSRRCKILTLEEIEYITDHLFVFTVNDRIRIDQSLSIEKAQRRMTLLAKAVIQTITKY
jgi:hypothetical protein